MPSLFSLKYTTNYHLHRQTKLQNFVQRFPKSIDINSPNFTASLLLILRTLRRIACNFGTNGDFVVILGLICTDILV